METTKIYAPGNFKLIKFNEGGGILKYSFPAEKMIEFCNKHKNEKGYVDIAIKARKEPDQYKNTHYGTLDTWKPKQAKEAKGDDLGW